MHFKPTKVIVNVVKSDKMQVKRFLVLNATKFDILQLYAYVSRRL